MELSLKLVNAVKRLFVSYCTLPTCGHVALFWLAYHHIDNMVEQIRLSGAGMKRLERDTKDAHTGHQIDEQQPKAIFDGPAWQSGQNNLAICSHK